MVNNFTDCMRDKDDYLTERQIRTMMSYCYNNNMTREYVFICVLFKTGRRVSEVVGQKRKYRKNNPGLRPMDINWDESCIKWHILKKYPTKKVNKGGGKRSNEVIIKDRINKPLYTALKKCDPKTLNWLAYYIKKAGIKPDKRIFPFTRQWAAAILKKIGKATNVDGVHCHIFRHSFSIHFLKKNENNPGAIRVLQQFLEHNNINITCTYLQFTQGDQEKLLLNAFGD